MRTLVIDRTLLPMVALEGGKQIQPTLGKRPSGAVNLPFCAVAPMGSSALALVE